jgi:hypothetical protein
MDYPMPIDAAGRTILVILCVGFLRLEGPIWVRGLFGSCIRPSAWIESCTRIDPVRVETRCFLAILRAVGGVSLLALIALWSTYALLRLAEELAAAPALAILGSSLGIVACRVLCPRGP